MGGWGGDLFQDGGRLAALTLQQRFAFSTADSDEHVGTPAAFLVLEGRDLLFRGPSRSIRCESLGQGQCVMGLRTK